MLAPQPRGFVKVFDSYVVHYFWGDIVRSVTFVLFYYVFRRGRNRCNALIGSFYKAVIPPSKRYYYLPGPITVA